MALAGRVDLWGIKQKIKQILDANNLEMGAPFLDLSDSMSKRVKKVFTLHPERIKPQASLYPAVCVYTDRKPISPSTIAVNQVRGKRTTDLTLTIVGMVWQNQVAGNNYDDPADKDIEILMENIEFILRNYPNLDGLGTWQFPNDVTYFSASFDEQTHFRVAFMDLRLKVFY